MEFFIYLFGLFIIIVQFSYILYMDRLNREERERMLLKLMSADVTEYKAVTNPPDRDTPEQTDEYLPLEEVDIEKLMKAGDNT